MKTFSHKPKNTKKMFLEKKDHKFISDIIHSYP